jgi:hypothetical protein
MLSDEDIKQLFMYCANDDEKGVYAEVDILEFARKIEAFVLAQEAKKSPTEGGQTRW